MKHRAENGNEELPAFLSEGIANRAVCGVGRDGLQTDRQTGAFEYVDQTRENFEELVR
jgi:hypothetical protein